MATFNKSISSIVLVIALIFGPISVAASKRETSRIAPSVAQGCVVRILGAALLAAGLGTAGYLWWNWDTVPKPQPQPQPDVLLPLRENLQQKLEQSVLVSELTVNIAKVADLSLGDLYERTATQLDYSRELADLASLSPKTRQIFLTSVERTLQAAGLEARSYRATREQTARHIALYVVMRLGFEAKLTLDAHEGLRKDQGIALASALEDMVRDEKNGIDFLAKDENTTSIPETHSTARDAYSSHLVGIKLSKTLSSEKSQLGIGDDKDPTAKSAR